MPNKSCVPNATAKEQVPALLVVAQAKDQSQVSQSVIVRSATELANAVAMFVGALAK
jgi:DNA-binding MltR family transcriptional regulator